MSSFYDRRADLVAAAAMLALVIVGVSLGLWQLRRADEKAAAQAALDRARAAPARVLGKAHGAVRGDPLPSPSEIEGLRVRAVGVFDVERSIFLDNRTHGGVAGMHVLTPLKLSGEAGTVIVLRGWIAQDPVDRNRLPALETPSGTVQIEGIASADFQQPMMLGDDPVPGAHDRLWQHFSFAKVERWIGSAPYPVIVRQTVEPGYRDRLVRAWNNPGTSVDRHRAYAFQWFALTGCAVAAGLVLVWRRRERRGVVPVSESS
jgi:cytochrome oxidase assembly protein ShyY1